MKARFDWAARMGFGEHNGKLVRGVVGGPSSPGVHDYEVARHHVRNDGHSVLVEFWHRARVHPMTTTTINYRLLFSDGGSIDCGSFDVDALQFDQDMLDMIWRKLLHKKTFHVTVSATITGGPRLVWSDIWVRRLTGDTRIQRGLPSNGYDRRPSNGNGTAALDRAAWD